VSETLDSFTQLAGLVLTTVSTVTGYLAYRVSRPATTPSTPTEATQARTSPNSPEPVAAVGATISQPTRMPQLLWKAAAVFAVLVMGWLPFAVTPPIRHTMTGTVDGYLTAASLVVAYFGATTLYVISRRREARTTGSILLIGLIVILFAVAGTQQLYDSGSHSIMDLIGAFLGWAVLTAIPACSWIAWRIHIPQ
jgi:hypothetical protein